MKQKIFSYKKRNIEAVVIFLSIFAAIMQVSCKKLVEVNAPVTAVTSGNVYSNDATAASVLTGIYTNMSKGSFSSGLKGISLRTGLSADELSLFGTDAILMAYFKNKLTAYVPETFWESFYNYLKTINVALEGLSKSTVLTPAVKQQLIGEAKFMRAFCHFYLVNLYGDVPLVIISDYRVNAEISRTPQAQVYQQIITDLKDAQNLLSNDYVGSDAISNTTERVRPNKWAATALLARVYLYNGDFVNAEAQATAVINNSALYNLTSLSGVFLKNSKEAIWQLQPVNTGFNTEDGRIFILPPSGPTSNNNFPVYLSTDLYNSFEIGDQRKLSWIGKSIAGSSNYYFPNKYKVQAGSGISEYLMVLRLAEQYLIRSEARIQNNNANGTVSDLNVVRHRSGLGDYMGATDKATMLTAILHERQVEFFSEWGHRWLDLKRTNNIDAVMNAVCPQKGSTWNTNWQRYPIPFYDIQQDSHLIQNLGY